jgi:predicted amidophosphoribosyltransferase
MHRDALRSTISWFKHSGRTGWALIFGRIIVGYLNEHEDEMAGYDLIVPNPTFPSLSGIQHTELTIEAAANNDDSFIGWPFDNAPWSLRKTKATPRSTSNRWDSKHEFARQHAEAIVVDARRVAGKRILLYDDVFTTGSQFHFVGLKLQEHGATAVDGLVLARRGWT